MKIIHTADIHLDSPLSRVKDPVKRRYELLQSLSDLAEYAVNNAVTAVIVAGDLFDDKFTTPQTVNAVAEIIRSSSADWYVLRGNHGDATPYAKLKSVCPQVNLFGDEWTYYNVENVTICGRELGVNDVERYAELSLDASRYNVVALHGDVDDCAYGLIDKKALAKSGAKYIALGHRHAFEQYRFGNVKACYSGVLEARGFDETQQTGFIVIDTVSDEIKFVPQALRSVVTLAVDVSSADNDVALAKTITDAVKAQSPRNYLNVVFVGESKEGVHLKLIAEQTLSDRFFALRIEDRTSLPYNLDELACEVSLRGEFVKLTMEIKDEDARQAALKFGLDALRGAELL